MKIENIERAELEAKRFLQRLKEVRKEQFLRGQEHTSASKETGALKRASMDLTRALSVMRQDTW